MGKQLLRLKKDFLYNSLDIERFQKGLIFNKKLYKGGFKFKLLKLLINLKIKNKFNFRLLTNWKISFLLLLLVNYISPYNTIKTFSWFVQKRKEKIKRSTHSPRILSFKKKYSITTLWFKLELKNNININLKSKIESELLKIFTFKSKIFLTRFRHSVLFKSLKLPKEGKNTNLIAKETLLALYPKNFSKHQKFLNFKNQ